MVADGLLTRKRYREVPPRVDYALTDRARDLMPVLGELARWGYEWTWSAPRATESVDIGAIFRLAGGLVRLEPGTDGIVELRIDSADAPSSTHTMRIADGHITVQEGSAARADARATGEVSDWVGAFSPGRHRDGLAITGDRALADQLLDALSAGQPRGDAAPAAQKPASNAA